MNSENFPLPVNKLDQRRPLVRPVVTNLKANDLVVVIIAVFGLVTAAWAMTGGWSQISGGWSNGWRAAASLTGLYTSLCGMVGLMLSARIKTIERAIGLDHLFIWHRIAGDTMGLLLAVHIFTSIPAEMPVRGGFINTVLDFTGREPYMALTAIGSAIVVVVVVLSLKDIRNKVSYETWYFVHLTVYFGLAASFSHQITLGSMLSNDRYVRVVWVATSAAIFSTALFGRWWKVFGSVSRPLHIQAINKETDDTFSMLLGGRNILRLRGDAGQFVMIRLLVAGQWWKTNPYSLSAVPTTAGLRVTIKDRGDASSATRLLRVGNRVAVEGPYGVTTPEIFDTGRPLFIAGGVGVTPVCALLQRLPINSRPTVLLRARHENEVAHLAEIRALANRCGGEVLVLTGRTAALKGKDPFSAKSLLRTVPDLASRVVLVCGPTSLMFAARKGVHEAGVSKSDIHMEMPWW
ncbi:MAG: hypothetical protein EXQ63_06310 [Ilumatobacteraceae bacterium]|nr:hypothetical protein [Ilumatobacteraceae bacterium]